MLSRLLQWPFSTSSRLLVHDLATYSFSRVSVDSAWPRHGRHGVCLMENRNGRLVPERCGRGMDRLSDRRVVQEWRSRGVGDGGVAQKSTVPISCLSYQPFSASQDESAFFRASDVSWGVWKSM